MLKGIFIFILYTFSVIIFIPFAISFGFNGTNMLNMEGISREDIEKDIDIINDVDFSETEQNNEISQDIKLNNNFEEYIVGVVAAEMPISFNEEALKAQAIAARTYAYKRIDNVNSEVDHNSIGQAYVSVDQMKSNWGSNFDTYYNKVKNAVYETQGIIMTYNNEPIEAVFHSTSAGMTEVSENIWGSSLPYIQSVDSKVDEKAPNFTYTTTISNSDIISKISAEYPNIDNNMIIETFEIKERSDADYVLSVSVCGEEISGRDIRTMFGLRSTNFTIVKNSDSIAFTTKGYGHGAGMSQYGAHFMAEDGKDYEEILNHYYIDIMFEKIY